MGESFAFKREILVRLFQTPAKKKKSLERRKRNNNRSRALFPHRENKKYLAINFLKANRYVYLITSTFITSLTVANLSYVFTFSLPTKLNLQEKDKKIFFSLFKKLLSLTLKNFETKINFRYKL